MDEKSISILGCGWLGLPLASHLLERKFEVKGSTTTPQKIQILQQAHVSPFLIDFEANPEPEGIKWFLDSKILFLNIPFRRDLKDPKTYLSLIDSIVSYVEPSLVEFLVFTSSTSVYQDDSKQVTEDSPLDLDNPRANVLNEIEQKLLNNDHFDATVIRFGGLYGGNRKIGQFLTGRKKLDHGDQPVNLIHLNDCLQIIINIIEGDVRGEIFNAVSDQHPTRRELYTEAAKQMGLKPPEFNEEGQSNGKVVMSDKLKEKLNYRFQHPDPMVFSTGSPVQ